MELVEIPSLGELFLSDNQLTGCVPVGLREVASNDLGSLGLADCKAPEPENVVATSTGATTIDLSWDEVDDTTVYRVEYRASDAAEWTLDDDAITSATHTVDETSVQHVLCVPGERLRGRRDLRGRLGLGVRSVGNNRHLQLAVALGLGLP